MTPSNGTSFKIGGDLEVRRLGFGAMRITGEGVWGPPRDKREAVRVLQRAVALGMDFIDTADSYGPHVSEELIREALHPYRNVVVATKGGLERPGPGQWTPNGRPEYLRKAVDGSLKRLGIERIDLYQLHRIDPKVPAEESLGVLKELQQAGKIRHLGLSEVSVAEIEQARKVVKVVSVQNLYNLANRQSEKVLDHCEKEQIAFIPWFPIATGELARPGGKLDALSLETGHTPSQLALAWLLQQSKVMLPIPGTGQIAHLEENAGASKVALQPAQLKALSAMA